MACIHWLGYRVEAKIYRQNIEKIKPKTCTCTTKWWEYYFFFLLFWWANPSKFKGHRHQRELFLSQFLLNLFRGNCNCSSSYMTEQEIHLVGPPLLSTNHQCCQQEHSCSILLPNGWILIIWPFLFKLREREHSKGQLLETMKAQDVTNNAHNAWLIEGKMRDQAMLPQQMFFSGSKLNSSRVIWSGIVTE